MQETPETVEVSVILPVYNERSAAAEIIERIRTVLDARGTSYELIVIDDGSTDGSSDILKSLPGIRLITHASRTGSGRSRRAGLDGAKGRIGVTLDADGTYRPEDIPALLDRMKDNDQVNGLRSKETGTLRPLRFLAKWFLNKVASFLAGRSIPDLNTGLKAFDIEKAKKFRWMMPDGFSSVSTLTLAFILNGYRVTWVPVEYLPRIGRSKFNPIKDTFRYLVTILRCCAYFNPLRTFLPAGAAILGAGVIKSALDIIENWRWETRFINIVLMLSGLVLIGLGIIADMLLTLGRKMNHE